MSEENKEDKIYAEWRNIVIQKLNSLDSDMKDLQTAIRAAVIIAKELDNLKEGTTSIDKQVESLKDKESESRAVILKEARETFITRDQFEPIKKLVWTVTSLTMLAVISAILSLLIRP